MLNIFQYDDYRLFLKETFEEKKRMFSGFSFRWFSKIAGFSSPNFMQQVIQNKKNLSKNSCVKICKAMKLNKIETEFFENLVFFNQSQTSKEKDHYYQLLSKTPQYRAIKPIERHQYEYHNVWYHAVVRELVIMPRFQQNPKLIAKNIFPQITEKEVEASISLLDNLGIIKKDTLGKWIHADPNISTGPEVFSLAVKNFHKTMIDLGKESIDTVPAAQRDISALTFAVSHSMFEHIKEKVILFRRELLEWCEKNNDNPEYVCQLNLQLFPVSQSIESEPLSKAR